MQYARYNSPLMFGTVCPRLSLYAQRRQLYGADLGASVVIRFNEKQTPTKVSYIIFKHLWIFDDERSRSQSYQYELMLVGTKFRYLQNSYLVVPRTSYMY